MRSHRRSADQIENWMAIRRRHIAAGCVEAQPSSPTAALASDLLERVRSASPAFFERLVVQLLVAMGYGGSIEDAGKALGKPGDEGIDGIIKEARLASM